MESLHRFSFRLLPLSIVNHSIHFYGTGNVSRSRLFSSPETLRSLTLGVSGMCPNFRFNPLRTRDDQSQMSRGNSSSSSSVARAGWLLGLGGDGKKDASLPDIVKAGDPVLHEPAQEVDPASIGSERIQKIIDDMVVSMRRAPGVGLAAPQIGVPLRIIVLEDTKEYMRYTTKEEIKAQDRRPFDLLVILNPKLQKTSNRTAFFFEGCLSIDGYRAVVGRYLDVEVSGLNRDGKPIKVEASGWQARILQHECDHLDGTLYVDKMVPRTFRITENLDLPLADGCPKLGARKK